MKTPEEEEKPQNFVIYVKVHISNISTMKFGYNIEGEMRQLEDGS
jgi:hypothetical protein